MNDPTHLLTGHGTHRPAGLLLEKRLELGCDIDLGQAANVVGTAWGTLTGRPALSTATKV